MNKYNFYERKVGYFVFNGEVNCYICLKNGKYFISRELFSKEFLESESTDLKYLKTLIKSKHSMLNSLYKFFIFNKNQLISFKEWNMEANKNYPCYFKTLYKETKITKGLFISSFILPFIFYITLMNFINTRDLILLSIIFYGVIGIIFYTFINLNNKKLCFKLIEEINNSGLAI